MDQGWVEDCSNGPRVGLGNCSSKSRFRSGFTPADPGSGVEVFQEADPEVGRPLFQWIQRWVGTGMVQWIQGQDERPSKVRGQGPLQRTRVQEGNGSVNLGSEKEIFGRGQRS